MQVTTLGCYYFSCYYFRAYYFTFTTFVATTLFANRPFLALGLGWPKWSMGWVKSTAFLQVRRSSGASKVWRTCGGPMI